MTHTPRALLALTSHDDLGGVRKTGFYVSEAADPWQVFRAAGYQVDVASVAGGMPPADGYDESSAVQRAFMTDPHIAAMLADTPTLASLDGANYDVVYYVGGHGTMWDFAHDAGVAQVARQVYEAGGVVAAVCHGPSALVNLTLSDGSALVEGKRVAAFTNEEEAAVELTEVVPFSLADALVERGATHVPAENFVEQVIVDGRLVTGQNPQSATGVAVAALEALAAR